MRRPPPLPPPPDPPVVPKVDVPVENPEQARPVTPFTGAGSSDQSDADVHSDATPAEHREDAEVRVRDVWRASRARRRALRSEVRRFTGRQRRRRAIWIGVGSSLLALVLITLGVAYSPLLAVKEITVVGAQQLEAEDVSAALSKQQGTPMPLVDESAVKAALIKFPLIESYTLEARPPHELVVHIVERTPIGVIKTPAGFTVVDAAGVVLSTTEKREGDQPLLSMADGAGADAFEALGEVMRALPADIRGRVTAAEASSPNDVRLTFGDTDTDVVWGGAEESALKAYTLQKIMLERTPEDVSVYDVSSPRAIVVR
jgi:cell division protein FtsQ